MLFTVLKSKTEMLPAMHACLQLDQCILRHLFSDFDEKINNEIKGMIFTLWWYQHIFSCQAASQQQQPPLPQPQPRVPHQSKKAGPVKKPGDGRLSPSQFDTSLKQFWILRKDLRSHGKIFLLDSKILCDAICQVGLQIIFYLMRLFFQV